MQQNGMEAQKYLATEAEIKDFLTVFKTDLDTCTASSPVEGFSFPIPTLKNLIVS